MRVTKPLALLFIGSSVLSGCASAPVVATLAQGQVGALRLESRDIAEGDFLAKRPSGTSAIVSGDLRLPEAGDGRRVPAVILVHGCSGVTAATENVYRWPDVKPPTAAISVRDGSAHSAACPV